MSKAIANTDAVISSDDIIGLVIDPITEEVITEALWTITTLPSLKVKTQGKGVYFGTISVSLVGGVFNGGVIVSALGTISPIAVKTKNIVGSIIRLDDEGTITGTYIPSGSTSAVSFEATMKVKSAGQEKVKAK